MALRRLHRQFGHCPQKVLINLLLAAKVDKAYVHGAKLLRRTKCEEAAPKRPAHKVATPEKYTFNHSLGIDILEVLDANGTKFQVLNMICLGTCFQLCSVVRKRPGQASSSVCLDALKRKWMTWARHPEVLRCNRGLHNRGVLAQ